MQGLSTETTELWKRQLLQLQHNSTELNRRVAIEAQLDEHLESYIDHRRALSGEGEETDAQRAFAVDPVQHSGLQTSTLAFDESGHFLVRT